MHVLGIDIGGSGIKGALVNLNSGKLATERVRIKTPPAFEIDTVTNALTVMVDKFNYSGSVGVGFPAAVADGVILTPPTAYHVPGLGESISQ